MSFVSKHHSSVEQFNDLIMLNVTINQLELGPLTFFFFTFLTILQDIFQGKSGLENG